MGKSVVALLTSYFNVGEGKRTNTQWLQELRDLSEEEKRELAEGVCAITGESIAAK